MTNTASYSRERQIALWSLKAYARRSKASVTQSRLLRSFGGSKPARFQSEWLRPSTAIEGT